MINSINNQQVNLPRTLQHSETQSFYSRVAQCSLSSAKGQSQESGSCYLIDCVKSIIKAIFTCVKKFLCCCFCCYESPTKSKSSQILDLQESENPIADLLSLKNGSNIKELVINVNKRGTIPSIPYLFKMILNVKTPDLEIFRLTVSCDNCGEESKDVVEMFKLCPKLKTVETHCFFDSKHEPQINSGPGHLDLREDKNCATTLQTHPNPQEVTELLLEGFQRAELESNDAKIYGKFENLEKVIIVDEAEVDEEDVQIFLKACNNFKDQQFFFTRD